uniref:Alternative protein FAM75D3 n=1 Tax=Homo sapiens TaxID=9606 RepID=L8E9E2_HUMAN|nr:alternative protein FAM75D3 [Homo sapiens]
MEESLVEGMQGWGHPNSEERAMLFITRHQGSRLGANLPQP